MRPQSCGARRLWQRQQAGILVMLSIYRVIAFLDASGHMEARLKHNDCESPAGERRSSVDLGVYQPAAHV